MIKVFLVEDELNIREGIKKRIAWEENGFLFAGEAENGETALPMIKRIRPDILITDIKMPFTDGLELSKKVIESFPDMKIILLSGYDDFAYARKAIEIGVADYLLKPVTARKLLEALMDAKQSLTGERKMQKFLQEQIRAGSENRKLESYRFFENLICANIPLEELRRRGEAVGIPWDAGAYNLCLFKITGNGFENNGVYREQLVQLEHGLEEYFHTKPGIWYFDRITEGTALLAAGKDEGKVQSLIEESINEIVKRVEALSEFSYFAGVGETVGGLDQIPECYQSANKVFSYRFFSEKSKVLYSGRDKNELREDCFNLLSIDLDKKIVLNFLKNGLKRDICIFVDKYLRKIGGGILNSPMFQQYILLDVNLVVQQFLTEVKCGQEEIRCQFKAFSNPELFTGSQENVREYLIKCFEMSMDLRDAAAANKYTAVIEHARDYINEHFADNQISLKVTAAAVNMSPNHFSRIFSQEVGMTFVEYLTQRRMQRAKELLRSTDIKISNVGYDVGYKDFHYFYNLFKKLEGCTPKDYRRRENRDNP